MFCAACIACPANSCCSAPRSCGRRQAAGKGAAAPSSPPFGAAGSGLHEELWVGGGRAVMLLLVTTCLPVAHLKLSSPWHLG